MKPPPIRYTSNPEARLAYQVLGEAPIDMVLLPTNYWNLDVVWEHPPMERFLRRLASFSRLIMFNPLGSGLSDSAPPKVPNSPESTVSGALEVMDAADSKRAVILAMESGGIPAVFLASTFPQRTTSLCLVNTYATLRRDEHYPCGMPSSARDRFVERLLAEYGNGEVLSTLAPELYGDEHFREWYARLERLTASPGQLLTNARGFSEAWDGRGILETIQAATLVISHTRHPWIRAGHGKYLSEHIAGARYVERPGFWGLFWVHDVDWVLDELQAFVTGTRGAVGSDDRVLATVLFTDIVGSTKIAAETGDERWRDILDEHDKIIHREIARFRGRTVKSTGDGIMATFDGPARAIRCAGALKEAVRSLGIEIRTGLHTGEVEQRGEDVGGIAVHIAARVMSEAGPNEVLVSGAVPPLVAGSGLEFDDRGSHELKGVPGEWRLYAVKA